MSKELALLRILEILWNDSDPEHPLTQKAIAEKLENDYDITLERKAIANKISLLAEAGFHIEKAEKGNGCFLSRRTFERYEIRILIDSVLCNRLLPPKAAATLIRKLERQCGRCDDGTRINLYAASNWTRSNEMRPLYCIEPIDAAITRRKPIQIFYGKYRADKKRTQSSKPVVSPYAMLFYNQRYYLFAYNNNRKQLVFYRIDHILDVKEREDYQYKPIREIKGFENGLDYRKVSEGMPYPFFDEPEPVVLRTTENMVDQMIDWFGPDVAVQEEGDGTIRVRVKASLPAMRLLALQYAASLEILEPESLRKDIAADLEAAAAKYAEKRQP